MATIVTRSSKGSALTHTEMDANFTNLNAGLGGEVVDDTTPQLGGDLDLNGNDITGTGAIPSANLSGALPAIDGSALTGMSGGLYSSVAIICDQKPWNIYGGAFNNGAWRTRDLNTEISDIDGIVSIASNQFTLQAGTYTIEASAPAYRVHFHQIRLYNITDSSVEQYGCAAMAWDNGNGVTRTFLSDVVTITAAKTFEIQHRCNATVTDGFGVAQLTDSASVSIYTQVKILKHT
jgi:hypothetical protein